MSRDRGAALAWALLLIAVVLVALLSLWLGQEAERIVGEAELQQSIDPDRVGAPSVEGGAGREDVVTEPGNANDGRTAAGIPGTPNPQAQVRGLIRANDLQMHELRVRLCRFNPKTREFFADSGTPIRTRLQADYDNLEAGPDWPTGRVWLRDLPAKTEHDGAYRLPVVLQTEPLDNRYRVEVWWAPDWTGGISAFNSDSQVLEEGLTPDGAIPVAYSQAFDLAFGQEYEVETLDVFAPIEIELQVDWATVPDAVRSDFIWELSEVLDGEGRQRQSLMGEPWWRGDVPIQRFVPPWWLGKRAQLVAGARSFLERTGIQTLAPGSNLFGPLTFPAPSSVSGTVVQMADDQPIAARRVMLLPAGRRNATSFSVASGAAIKTTDDDGRFSFPVVLPGDYVLRTFEDAWDETEELRGTVSGPPVDFEITVGPGEAWDDVLRIGREVVPLEVTLEGLPAKGSYLVFVFPEGSSALSPMFQPKNPFTLKVPAGVRVDLRVTTAQEQADEAHIEVFGTYRPDDQPDAQVRLVPHPTEFVLTPPQALFSPSVVLTPASHGTAPPLHPSPDDWRNHYALFLPSVNEPRTVRGLPAGLYTAREGMPANGLDPVTWQVQIP